MPYTEFLHWTAFYELERQAAADPEAFSESQEQSPDEQLAFLRGIQAAKQRKKERDALTHGRNPRNRPTRK